MSNEVEIKEMLTKHISDSNEWRIASDEKMDLMQETIDRLQDYETGFRAVVTVGRFIIATVGILGAIYVFFATYFRVK